MTVLERIRSRVGLLVGVIMFAILAFVLGDLFSGKFGIFNGGNDAIAEIAGHTIKPNEWTEMENAETQNFMIRTGGQQNPDEQQKEQIRQTTWQNLLDKYLLDEGQFKELGILVTDDELAEKMLSDHPDPVMKQVFGNGQGAILQNFALATNPNELDMVRVREYVASLKGDNDQAKMALAQWVMTENAIRKYLLKQKYYNLIKKGLYTTSAQARMEHKADSTLYTIRYVARKYSDLPDSTIAITDADLKAYYDSHLYKFKEKDNKRNIEYVAFDVNPSQADVENTRKRMVDAAAQYEKITKPGEDSSFVMNNGDGSYNVQKFKEGNYPMGTTDSTFIKAGKGKVVGPIDVLGTFQIYKVRNFGSVADSGRVRHILISYTGKGRTKEQSKKLADSLVAVIKKGTKMESLVEKFTDDPGSLPHPEAPEEKDRAGNKGDYGWLKDDGRMVPEFTNFALQRNKGEVDVVETTYGYHVMQSIDRSKTSHMTVEVVGISAKPEPSNMTMDSVYAKASQFALKNNTGDLFNAAVKKDNMNKLIATDIVLDRNYIQGIQENQKEIIRWVYKEETKVGSVSEPFNVGKRYIVCNVTAIKEKGYKPLEDVKAQIEVDVRKQKKAERFIAEMSKAKAATIEAYAANLKLNVTTANNISFNSPNFFGMGYEGEVVGKLVNMKKGELAGPLKGNMGVYVLVVDDIKQAGELKNPKEKQKMLTGSYIYRVEGEAFEVLKDMAEIEDNRSKFF